MAPDTHEIGEHGQLDYAGGHESQLKSRGDNEEENEQQKEDGRTWDVMREILQRGGTWI